MNQKRIAVITGANTGMGKATARALAENGDRVVMVCRSRERGEAALQEVKSQSGNPDVELMICDLSSLDSVNEFCRDFRMKYKQLHVLINNAGVIVPDYRTTSEGYELQFGVNHLAHFLLTDRLLDLLKEGAPARIINVASVAHKSGKIYFDDVNLKQNYGAWRAYAQSKLANVLFTYRLAEMLEGSGVTVNCLHPGTVATNIVVKQNSPIGKLIARIMGWLIMPPEKGAETAVYLASSGEVEGITGKYFYRKKPVPSSRLSYDKETAGKLWDLSVKMTSY